MKMIFEGMEESGSVDLDKFIEKEKDQFFAGIDCMCISGKRSTALCISVGADHQTTTGSTPRPLT
jgi:acetylornithine deacetylase/succinyl-diaminopimelate desuccinylase-like protein